MPLLIGRVGIYGPLLDIKVMQSPQRVNVLKRAGMRFAPPVIVPALIDTGASCLAIDLHILQGLNVPPTGTVKVHTPSTEGDGDEMLQFDVHVIIGEGQSHPLQLVLPVVAVTLASQGIGALIGREVLQYCQLIYDGPQSIFSLTYNQESASS